MAIGEGILNAFEAAQPALGPAGEWGTVGGFALREALSRGSMVGVMEVFDGLDAPATATLLREAGFEVSEGAIDLGQEVVLSQAQNDLIEAAQQRVDGFEIRRSRFSLVQEQVEKTFAAKEVNVFAGFPGDQAAAIAIQEVLSAYQVEVDLFGSMIPAERVSLQFIAGQAMEAKIQGFAFDGLPGKYQVGFGLQEILDLHGAASVATALEIVGEATEVWRKGGSVGLLPENIPGTVQRALQGSLSEEAAGVLVRAVDGGALAEWARDTGIHAIRSNLLLQGLDVDAPLVDAQAAELGLSVAPLMSGQKYAGPVVGMDHCALLVKYSRDKAVVVAFSEIGQAPRPRIGEMVKVDYSKEDLRFIAGEQGISTGLGR